MIVVGDIHACLEEFDMLMELVEYKKGSNLLILLGDLIDRGPDAAGVVRRAQELEARSVMGNHEEKALRWRRHEARRKADPTHYKNPMADINVSRLAEWARISEEDWEWINKMPITFPITRDWVAVHAGFMPGVVMDQQRANEMMRIRYVKPGAKKMANLDARGEAPSEAVHWTTLWNGPEKLVYGHYTYMDGYKHTHHTLGIDTGCVHGGQLTAAVFYYNTPNYSLASVQAKKVYAERKYWNEE